MKIGITTQIQFSLFSGGAGGTSLALGEVFRNSGHEVWLINTNPSAEWWDDCQSLKQAWSPWICSVIDLGSGKFPGDGRKFDLVIEVDKPCFPSGADRKKISNTNIWLVRKSPILHDIEASLFPFDNSIRNLDGLDAVWAFDKTCSDDDLKYLEVLTRAKAEFSPFVWTPTHLEIHRNETKAPEWLQVAEAMGKDKPWHVHICETNNSVASSVTLPLVILKDVKQRGGFSVKEWIAHNSDHVSKSLFFQNNVRKHCEISDLSGVYMGRQRVIDWIYDPMSCLLSHSRFTTVRLFHLDAAWVGLPMVHNSQFLHDISGCGYDKLYYPDNEVVAASKALQQLQKDFESKTGIFTVEARNIFRKTVLSTITPYSKELCEKYACMAERFASSTTPVSTPTSVVVPVQVAAKEEESVKPSTNSKSLNILFTDMWDGFNPSYNMFTVMMNEAGRHLEKRVTVEGHSFETIGNKKPDLVIFGPFGQDWYKTSPEIPKVHFTGENSKMIAHDSIKLNIGFQHADFVDQQYLRLPLWMLEIDWFGVDKEKIANPKPLPIDRCTKVFPDDISRKQKFCAFVVTNPCNPVRNNSFLWLSQYKQVDSAGRLFNNVGDAIFAGLGGGGGELKKFEFLRDYKFCLAYENSSSQGYTTEKYLHAKAAGCIPIYWGDPKFERDFDIEGCIDARRFTQPEELIEAVRSVDENPMVWLKKFSVPALDETRRDLTRRTLSECSRRLLKLALGSDDGLDKIPRFLGATSDKEAQEMANAREGVIPEIKVDVTVVEEPKKVSVKSNLVSEPRTNPQISTILVCTAATKRFLPSLHQWLVGMTAQKQNPSLSMEADVWLGKDIEQETESELVKEFQWIRFHRFPNIKVDGFEGYWDPQHFAWKLWLLHEIVTKKEHAGKMVLYLDSGAFMCRWPIDWIYIAKENGICALEDPRETNDRWCSDMFCKKMNVTASEKMEHQLWAGSIAFEAGHQKAIDIFTEAFKLSMDPEIIVGPKWEGVRDGKPYGHRHDQSILSILTSRMNVARYPMDLIYCDESLRRTFMTKKAFYVHRGGFQVHKKFLSEIDDCYVINLDRRADRMEKLFTNSPELKGNVQRVSAVEGKKLQMTPTLARLFRPHDFGWKKPVLGCALSHLGIWWQLANERDDINSYLILEDDVKFKSGWQAKWEEASAHLPEDFDVIYLGGILPPNRQGFEAVKEKVNPYFSKVAENNFFGQNPKNRYFHWCAYSYVLSKQGARKILEVLKAKDGYWTSADHMVCNMVNIMNIYFLDPLVAGCYQDEDPRYQNSAFNDFSRVDGFDSDLWNNNECFDKGQMEALANMNIPLDIGVALSEARNYLLEKNLGEESQNEAKENLVNEVKGEVNEVKHEVEICADWKNLYETLKSNPLEARNKAFELLEGWKEEWKNNSFDDFMCFSECFDMKHIPGLPTRDKLIFLKEKVVEIFQSVNPAIKAIVEDIIGKFDTMIQTIELNVLPPKVNGRRVLALKEQNLTCSTLYEASWLKELFGKNQDLFVESIGVDDEPPKDEPILIIMRPWWPKIMTMLRNWQEAGSKFFLLHLSDETSNDPLFFYGWDECLGVIRNYWREDIEIYGDKVLVIPLGYHWTKNEGNEDPAVNTPRLPFREKVWSFLGTNWNGREEKMKNLSLIQPHDVRWFKEWNDAQMLGRDEYLNIMLDSRFVPCPGGVNPETYRFYEALECGCVPLYVRQEGDSLYIEKQLKGNIPIVDLPSWDHAAALMYQFNNNPMLLENYRMSVLEGYKTWKAKLKTKVQDFLKI